MLKLTRKCLQCQKDFKSKSIYIRTCDRCKDDTRGRVYTISGRFINTEYGRRVNISEE